MTVLLVSFSCPIGHPTRLWEVWRVKQENNKVETVEDLINPIKENRPDILTGGTLEKITEKLDPDLYI